MPSDQQKPTKHALSSSLLGSCALAIALVACGNEPSATTPTQPTGSPAPTSEPEVAKVEPPPTPTASASAKAGPPPKAAESGRPAVLKSDSSEITDTFGSSPASKLELGDSDKAVLRLPEGALRTGTNITWRIGKGAKSIGAAIGKIYEIRAMVPPSNTPESVESNGPPFVIELPAGGKKDANLAIGVTDDKGKVKWTVVAPKRIDDARNVAIFELATLPSGFVHITTKPPAN